MPKKRSSAKFPKPVAPVHPSMSSTGPAPKSRTVPRSLHSAPSTTDNPVNDLIHRKRLSHVSPSPILTERSPDPRNIQTLPPSLNAILRGSHTGRARPLLAYDTAGGRTVRGPAGPAPPRSWITRNQHHESSARKYGLLLPGRPLPGLCVPDQRSLLYQTLKYMAIQWDWHLQYDRDGLAALPMKYKERLLYFMASYNPGRLTPAGLEVLFADDGALEDGTATTCLTHLDLAWTIRQGCSLRDLMDVFVGKPDTGLTSNQDTDTTVIPDAWDAPESFAILHGQTPSISFLTHLSLSHSLEASWKSLLDVVPHLPTLTHLSLAFWPTPSFHPVEEGCNLSAPHFHQQAINGDKNHAAAILRRLSRATYCLKWLDLTGCCGWIWALNDGPDWRGAWRGVRTVKAAQFEVLDLDVKAALDWYIDEQRRNHPSGGSPKCWHEMVDWLRYARTMWKLEIFVNRHKTDYPMTPKPQPWHSTAELAELAEMAEVEELMEMWQVEDVLSSIERSEGTTTSMRSGSLASWLDWFDVERGSIDDKPRNGGRRDWVVFESSPDYYYHKNLLIESLNARGLRIENLPVIAI